jgi:hypothetical protein
MALVVNLWSYERFQLGRPYIQPEQYTAELYGGGHGRSTDHGLPLDKMSGTPHDYANDNFFFHGTHILSGIFFLCNHSGRAFRFGPRTRHSMNSSTT